MWKIGLAIAPRAGMIGLLILLGVSSAGCQWSEPGSAQTRPSVPGTDAEVPAVDVAIAQDGTLGSAIEYTGTTVPHQVVSLRSQVEGQLLEVNVDVGDVVSQGQILARQDDRLLLAGIAEAEAEVTAREGEVASAQAEVGEAQSAVEQARLEFQQAQSDLARQEQLYQEGVVTEQSVEQARTAVGTAEQVVRSAQERVRRLEQSVTVAQRRVIAQQAIALQEQERRSYTILTAPINGLVLERVTEPGNLAQAGSEILKIGDFSQIKVAVQVSELEIATIQLGQSVQVRLDALPDEVVPGQVSRISPAADPTARLIPVEVTIPNRDGRLKSGLLARVNFSQPLSQRVVIPETALQTSELPGIPQDDAAESSSGVVFVVNGSGESATVLARSVQLGDRADGLVEIISGLRPGESFVVRSSDALQDGDRVRLSVISESS
jgi:RND family efflux transporter MFP subunit